MLQAIRNRAQGWIAWVVVILISIPFALFGINEYLGVDPDPAVAEVEGIEVKEGELQRRMRDLRDNMRASLGNNYRAELFSDAMLRSRVLDQMIDELVLKQVAEDWNIRASDAQVHAFIHAIPTFQRDGRFDFGLYRSALRNRGMSEEQFELAIRQEMALDQIQQGVGNSAFVTEAALSNQVRLAEQKRSIRYFTIPASNFNNKEAVTEEEAQAYYKQHSHQFRAPEKVKLAYVLLNDQSLSPLVEVNEDQLQAYFDQHQDEFVAEEERQMRHILIGPQTGDATAQQTKAADLLRQLREGADFAELAKEHSEDPGSSANGGDLGWVNKGVMVKPFEDAAFALAKDAISDVVESDFGYHIIQVTDIRGSGEPSFVELREEVAERYRKEQVQELYYNYFERFADAAYENPDNLLPVAELLSAEIQQTDWIERNGQWPEALNAGKVKNTAFSTEVLQGNNSDVIELSPGNALVLRVLEHEPSTVKPFADVRDTVINQAAQSLARDKAVAKGKEAVEALKKGENISDMAQTNTWVLAEARDMAREQHDVPAEIVQTAFKLAKPQAGKQVYGGVASTEGDYIVIALEKVIDGELAQLAETEQTSRQQTLQTSEAGADMQLVRDALRERANVEIY
jgi:peptidyl-prolyl cis-trans isomerase D